MDGVLNMVEWLMVQRDNREVERAAKQAAREAETTARGAMPAALRRVNTFRGSRT